MYVDTWQLLFHEFKWFLGETFPVVVIILREETLNQINELVENMSSQWFLRETYSVVHCNALDSRDFESNQCRQANEEACELNCLSRRSDLARSLWWKPIFFQKLFLNAFIFSNYEIFAAITSVLDYYSQFFKNLVSMIKSYVSLCPMFRLAPLTPNLRWRH